MKKCKRLLALLLAGILTLALLTGCKKDASYASQVQDAIVAMVNERYELELTNDPTLREAAARMLEQATEDAQISRKNAFYLHETTDHDLIYTQVHMACVAEQEMPQTQAMERMFPLEAFRNELPANLQSALDYYLNDGYSQARILKFGVAVRVIGDEGYVAFAFKGVAAMYYG